MIEISFTSVKGFPWSDRCGTSCFFRTRVFVLGIVLDLGNLCKERNGQGLIFLIGLDLFHLKYLPFFSSGKLTVSNINLLC